MTDTQAVPELVGGDPNTSEAKTANLVYILYLVGIVFGITSVIGVILAYVNRAGSPAWLASHFAFQIRTFWYSVLFWIVGLLTTIVLVGWLVLLLWLGWYIVRCAAGMKYLSRGQAHPDPAALMFG